MEPININSLQIQLVQCKSPINQLEPKSDKNNYNKLVATVHHLKVNIYNHYTITKLGTARALVDTGCSMTSISSTFYNQLNSFGDLKISKPKNNITTTTCDGSENDIAGITTIMVGFNTNDSSRSFGVAINVLIIPNLQSKIILGLDFLASDYVYKMTPNKIYYQYKGHLISEPFDKTTFNIEKSTDNAVVAPNKFIQITIPFEKEPSQYKFSSSIHFLQIKETELKEKSATFKLINNSPYNIEFPIDKPLIAVTQISKPSQKFHSINSDNKIDYVDEYMDDKEILQAESLLLDTGSFQPSLTSFIESKPTITEFELIDEPKTLTDSELLKEFELDHLPPKEKTQMVNIILSCRPAFSLHKYDIGKTNVLEMDIELINDQHPKIQKYHPIPLHARDKVKDILDQMEHHGIIRVCNEPSQYVSNIMVIPKKDKSSIRLLFDGRLLNYDTKRLPMAFVSKPEIIGHLMDRNHLSSLDFSDAFFHIPLSKKAQPLTAFYAETNNKRMCFTRAPQGLKNSPLYLKILLDKIFHDLSDNLLFYVDDLLIATKGTLEEHFNLIEVVLHRLIRSGLKLRPQKLLLARQQIQFLGMIFERDKLSIPEARIKAFNELPSPNTPKKLKSAICAFSYYRNFIPDFSTHSRELMELSNLHPSQFSFTQTHETLFRNLIKHICNHTTSYFPVPNKPFYIQTDASLYCAGGRLYQLDDNKNERLIAAVSRTFTKTERNYSIFKKEALALLYTLRSMEFFIRYAPKLIILVDAKALIYIRLAKESTGILLRFSLELSKYEADIIHVPGKDNEISDLLSRSHKDITDIQMDIANNKTINEKETIRIIRALTLPGNFTLTREQLIHLLDGPSPKHESPSLCKTKSKSKGSSSMAVKKLVRNTPAILSNRKTRMPRLTSAKRPGVILPIKVNRQTKHKTIKVNRQTKHNTNQTIKVNERNRNKTIATTPGKLDKLGKLGRQDIYKQGSSPGKLDKLGKLGKQDITSVKGKQNLSNNNQGQAKGPSNKVELGNGGAGDNQQPATNVNSYNLRNRKVSFSPFSPKKRPSSADKHSRPSSQVARDDGSSLDNSSDSGVGGTIQIGNLSDFGYFDQEDEGRDKLHPPVDGSYQSVTCTAPAHGPLYSSGSMEAFTDLGHSDENECLGSAMGVMGDKKLLVPSSITPASQRLRELYGDCLTRCAHLDCPVRGGNGEVVDIADAPDPCQDVEPPDTLNKGSVENHVDAMGRVKAKGNESKSSRGEGVHTQTSVDFRHHVPSHYETIKFDCLLGNRVFNRRDFYDLQLQDSAIQGCINSSDENLLLDQGIYYYNLRGNKKPYLPQSLARILINNHHYSHPGLHKSRAQIARDINGVYYIDNKILNNLINLDTGSCHVCQLFDNNTQSDITGSLPRSDKPRLSWSIDLITDLPKSVNNYKILLVAVDDFSNYLIAVPLKDLSSMELIRAIRYNIFRPFGYPKSIRSDEQPSIYNSNEFYEFLKTHSVELHATAVASPFSNGRIERYIRTFKHTARKYFYQNNCLDKWDEHIDIIVNSLNSSINSFNHSPEEIMFGHRVPNKLDLVNITQDVSDNSDPSAKIDKLIDRANLIRHNYNKRKQAKEKSNTTFKNKSAINKQFALGDLVLHRQLQVSTGTSSKWKPLFTGPFIIEEVHKDKTFSCKNLITNRVIRAHGTNLTHYKIDRSTIKITTDRLNNPIYT